MQDNPQGTATWIQARIGHATASRAGAIVRRKKNDEPYSTYHDYVYELVQERLTNQAADHYTSPAMQHGIDTEAEAALAYAMMTGATLAQSPFIRHPTIEWASWARTGFWKSNAPRRRPILKACSAPPSTRTTAGSASGKWPARAGNTMTG